MDSRTGKLYHLIGVLLLCVPVWSCANVSLRLAYTDMQGEPLKSVGAGVPFSLSLTVTADEDIQSDPVIRNLDKFFYTAGSAQASMQNINGHVAIRRVKHYQMRIDAQGTVTIGPARVEHNGTVYQSNILTIPVRAQEQAKKGRGDARSEALLMVSLSKERVYLHEPLSLRVRFLYRGDLHGIKPQVPEIANVIINESAHADAGTIELNGKQWQFQEWVLALSPEKVGTITVPRMTFVYQVVKENSPASAHGMLAMLVGPQLVNKRAQSEAMSFQVLPLPRPVRSEHVGQFSHFTATVNEKKAMEGDAIVLTLSVKGPTGVKSLQLVPQLPESLKSYHSRTKVTPATQRGTSTVTSEYVLQGTAAGTVKIPAQTFTYFDPRAAKYKTLKSSAITLTITERPAMSVGGQEDSEQKADPVLLPIGSTVPPVALPAGWFLLINGLMLLLALVAAAYGWWNRYCHTHYYQLRKWFSQKKALRELNRLKAVSMPSGMHALFIEYLSARLEKDPGEIDEADLKTVLAQHGFDVKSCDKWSLFWEAVNAESFGGSVKKTVSTHKLFDQAEQWLVQLEKKL